MNYEEIERDIKKELRAAMNGILSARMRAAGMPFRLIFGVELPRLRTIAAEFPQDKNLAKLLWSRRIRETRLMAFMLMPLPFSADEAEQWIGEIETAEEAQIFSMLLLPQTDGILEAVLRWANRTDGWYATCAFLTLSHLISRGHILSSDEMQSIEVAAEKALPTAHLHLKKAILTTQERLLSKKEEQKVR